MSRPRYETSDQKARERAMARRLTEATGWSIHEQRQGSRIDWLAFKRGVPWAYLEFKSRKIRPGQYPTIVLSLTKAMAGIQRGQLLGVPFLFCVEMEDGGLYVAEVSAPIRREWVRVGGRTRQTRDPEDVEPCIYLPAGRFQRVCDAAQEAS